MKKKNRKYACAAACLLAAFVLWTVLVCFADVQPIGPQGSEVGLAALNRFVHALTGVHMFLYMLTDWLSLAPLAFAAGFALLGLRQWIERKHIRRVDHSIQVLGVFYAAVIAAYALFDALAINFRPVYIDGKLEASYPSSTTMLVICVTCTAAMQLRARIRNRRIKRCIAPAAAAFIVFMVGGRLVSGVHWFSDIAGGVLLGAGLVLLYRAFSDGNAE